MRDKSPETQALLDEFRHGPCELCNKLGPTDPHHLYTVGAGEVNHRRNLMALCRSCHTRVGAGNVSGWVCLCVVAIREGCDPRDIENTVFEARRERSRG